jgi:hypothetical protein
VSKPPQTHTPVSQIFPPLQPAWQRMPPEPRHQLSLSRQVLLLQHPYGHVLALQGRHAPPPHPFAHDEVLEP